jgi:hypothetical protein
MALNKKGKGAGRLRHGKNQSMLSDGKGRGKQDRGRGWAGRTLDCLILVCLACGAYAGCDQESAIAVRQSTTTQTQTSSPKECERGCGI